MQIYVYLGLFKVISYFPNGKSNIWGIYTVVNIFLFFGHPLSKSKYMYAYHDPQEWVYDQSP
jgi:hypothetical protein